MNQKLYILLVSLTSCVFLFSCKESHESGYDTLAKMHLETPTKTKEYGELLPQKERREFLPDIPQIGSTAELGEDRTCREYGDILAYAQTAKYRIYICGDETNNQPKLMVLCARDSNSHKTIISRNPSITWDRSYAFKQEPYYRLDRPNSIIYYGYPHEFFFLVTKSFDSTTELIKEPIQVYLYNEKAEPNYRKTVLPFDDRAKDRFLKFLPVLNKQFSVCSDDRYIFKPDRVIAYEIDPQKYLIELVCNVYSRSTRNPLTQYILYSEDSLEPKAKIIPFYTFLLSMTDKPITDKTMGEKLSVNGRALFFPEDNTVRIYTTESGGYGTAQEYKLIEDRFELQEYREHHSTATSRPKSPEEFPKIYP